MAQMSNVRYKDLWGRMKTITERRLAFDRQMRDRTARAQEGERQTARTSTPAQSDFEQCRPSPSIDHNSGVLSVEGKVTYLKLQGDQLVHLAEMANLERNDGNSDVVVVDEKIKDLASQAIDAYLSARRAASGFCDKGESGDISCHNKTNSCSGNCGSCPSLPELHPLRLELAWRTSFVLFYLLGRPVEAWEAAYPIFTVAAEYPARLGQRTFTILELLRDQLAVIDVRAADGSKYREGKGPCCAVHDHDSIREGWGFLRASETTNSCVGMVNDASGGGAWLRDIVAQVGLSRARMDGVVKVLLGTMVEANIIFLALKTIFAAFVKRYAVSAPKCSNTDNADIGTDNSVWRQGHLRNVRRFPACRPLLSWAGFEAVCYHFKLAKRGSANTIYSADRGPAQQASCRSPSAEESGLQLGESESAARAGEGLLLTGIQILVAFICACTHGSVLASFPDDSGEAAATAVGKAAEDAIGYNGGMKRHRSRDEEDAYWKDVEDRLVNAARRKTTVPQGEGLSFPQFVDALARCGLLVGDLPPTIDACKEAYRIEWRAVANLRKPSQSPGGRIQTLFTTHMGLVDSENVRTRLRELDAVEKK